MRTRILLAVFVILSCGVLFAQQPFSDWNKDIEDANRRLLDEKVTAARNIKEDVQREADWAATLFWLFLAVGGIAVGLFLLRMYHWTKEAKDHVQKAEQSAKNAKLILDELEKRHRELGKLIKESQEQIKKSIGQGEEKFREAAREEMGKIRAAGEKEQAAFELFTKALRLHDENRYDEAIKVWDEVIERDGEDARPFCNRGLAKHMKGYLGRAIKDFSKAISICEKTGDTLYSATAYNLRGAVKKERGDHIGAVSDYEEAIQLDPSNAQAYCNRGIVKGEDGDHNSAIADYDKALELNTDFGLAFFNWASVLAIKGEKEEMMEKLSRAIFLDSSVKRQARELEHFKKYWKDSDFKKLTRA